MTTILVVDDSNVDRMYAAGLLAHENAWNVIQAADGKAALVAVKTQAPDIIVTDIQMPELNGLELLAELRKSHSHIPVILMTSRGSEEIAVEALQSGASSYVPKRSLASTLVDTIQRVVAAMQETRKHSELMNRLGERIETYVLENDVNLVMALSRHLQSLLADSWGLDRTDRMRTGTAIEEALLNAMYHGNLEVSSELKERDHQAFYALADERRLAAPWINRRIRVRIEMNAETAKVVIRDDGTGFDPAQLPDPTDPENLGRPFGRGVMLMRAFMDDVSYNAVGNEVTLTRSRFRE
ncbi:ATP-binding response regulator [Schlesneria paludicola]|uniref:ATP-binding response regulator n=1 Tax=Schlesneria paludicola TaxID=360056 RepID=UPI00029AE1E1|nr:response regulator [Schlesneria paludicola]